MPAQERLARLRGWFVLYYLFNLVLGTWTSVVVVGGFRTSSMPFREEMGLIPDGAVILWSLFIGAAVFGLGMLLYHHLLKRETWARAIVLIIAWLTGISSLTSMVSLYGMTSSGWLARSIPDADWGLIGVLSALTNLASLTFSVYTIRTLQFDSDIRQEFGAPGRHQQ